MRNEVAGTPISVRNYLRLSTAPLHARVDAFMSRCLDQGSEGYAQFLALSAAAVLPLESALSDANVRMIVPDWPRRSRAAALRADLAELDVPVPEARIVPKITEEAFLFGILYVLEGSRLGARVMLESIQVSSSDAARSATRYLSHGRDQRLWQTFLPQMEASSATHDRPDVAASGAHAAFQLFLPPESPAGLTEIGDRLG